MAPSESTLLNATDYYRRGFMVGVFKSSPTHNELLDVLVEIRQNRLRPGFQWKDNLENHRRDLTNQADLKPNASEYSDVFLRVLAENRIPELMRTLLGGSETLANIAVVDSIPPGYWSVWHVDNFATPIHKLIFYPSFGRPARPRLQILEGHVKSPDVHRLRTRLRNNRVAWNLSPRFFKGSLRTIESSDAEYVIVNTQTLHRAVDVTDENGALRLLYSFRREFRDAEDRARYRQGSDTRIDLIEAVGKRYQAFKQ